MGSITPVPFLPYWQTNIPPSLRTRECPTYLQNLSHKDISILHTPDTLFQRLSWPLILQIIHSNRLDLFQRKPSDLRLYLEFCYNVKRQYGSVMRYILDVELQWDDSDKDSWSGENENGNENENVLRVRVNDWPYGVDEKIVHLVVWSKCAWEDDAETGDIRDDVKREIDRWVDRIFGERCGSENVIWFRNWRSLKSIHAVEHFHVMLYDPDPEFVREVTKRDIRCRGGVMVKS
ncbi:hypothetical protein SBOR_7236 [Sclerotinia borealis F-4128]|uniref:N-acetylglucosamine-induced protein 1 n=1 Tax=Sclerotinia borealis (strain F-4128) TaxID=1432307 RepID=W9C962_SCLBF|nr:hypothetical protein SBOR_7236 [Sclerotinia borealis F-4128]